MTDIKVGEEALFGSNNITDSRRLRDMYDHHLRRFITDTEQQILRKMVKEAARFGIAEEDVLHETEIVWRCEARARLVVKKLPEEDTDG